MCHISTDCAVQYESRNRAKRKLVFLCDTDIEVSQHMCVREKTDLTACVYTRDSQQNVCV